MHAPLQIDPRLPRVDLRVMQTFGERMMKGTIIATCLAVFAAGCMREREPTSGMQHRLDAVTYAIELFEIDHDRLPSQLEDLLPLTNQSWGSASTSGYLDRDAIIDSWGNDLQYLVLTNGFSIRSAGQDGKFETQDDLARTETK